MISTDALKSGRLSGGRSHRLDKQVRDYGCPIKKRENEVCLQLRTIAMLQVSLSISLCTNFEDYQDFLLGLAVPPNLIFEDI